MAHLATSRLLRPLLLAVLGLMVGCSTMHEADLGANRGYNEFGSAAYKPSLIGKGKSKTAPVAIQPKKAPQYSPMVERTATGVRTVKDFSSQAKNKSARNNADVNRATRTQQNSKVAKSYNDDNLLTR